MIRSYRVFVGKTMLREYGIFVGALLAVTAAAGIVRKNVSVEWLSGFIDGAVPFFASIAAPVCSAVSLIEIYNANVPSQPAGYKYFHSLENSAERFRYAVIFGNILSLAALVCLSSAVLVFFGAENMTAVIFFAFFAVGAMNFLGYTRTIWSRIILMIILGFAAGMLEGLRGEDDPAGMPLFLTVIGIVSAAVYLGGLIFSITKAKTAWIKERDK